MEDKKSEGKKIVVNGIFFATYKLLNVLFPLITSVYVARVLLPSGTGKVAYAQNIVTYFTLVAALGLPIYGTREIARALKTKKNYNNIFWELFSINAISTTMCVISYYTLCLLVPAFKSELSLHIVAGFSIVLNYFNIDWLYQGREEYKYISIRGVIIKCLSVIMLFIFVKDVNDYVLYAGIQCFVLGGNNLVNLLGLKERIGKPIRILSFKQHFKPLIILFATNVAIELYTLLDTTMLGILCPDDIVGFYSYAMKTTKIVITILTAVTTVMLPKLSDYYVQGNISSYMSLANKGLVFVLITSIPCSVLLFSNSNLIIKVLYGNDYLGANTSLMILSVLIIPITLSTYIGTQILCSANLEKKMLIAVIAGAVSNIALNSLLIRTYQQNGASLASVTSETIVAIIEIVYAKKIGGVKFNNKITGTAIVGSIVMYVGITAVKSVFENDFISLSISSIIGVIIYFVIFIVIQKL